MWMQQFYSSTKGDKDKCGGIFVVVVVMEIGVVIVVVVVVMGCQSANIFK